MSISNLTDDGRIVTRPLDPNLLRFLSQLAHELRTPLTGIKASIGVVLANEPSGTSEAHRRMFQAIDAAADRMAQMIDDLSQLVRLHTRASGLSCEVEEIGALVRRAVESAMRDGAPWERRIEITEPEEQIFARLDRDQTIRAIGSLLGAVTKLVGGGGTIRVAVGSERSDVTVRIVGEKAGTRDGQESLPAPGRVATDGRIGLELAVAAAIVQRHRGQIALELTEGGEIAFRVSLPTGGPGEPAAAEHELRGAES